MDGGPEAAAPKGDALTESALGCKVAGLSGEATAYDRAEA